MSDARTMTRYLVTDKWKEAIDLQLQINEKSPAIIAATESRMLEDIREMITNRRAAHGCAFGARVDMIMEIVKTPFEYETLPEELHPMLKTRVLFYAFIIGFMHNGMLVRYCETALRTFPDQRAPLRKKYAYVVREIMYLAMLRLDVHARAYLSETCLDQYSSIVSMIMEAHPDLSENSPRPIPSDAHERWYVDDSLEAIGIPTPSLEAAWNMNEAMRCEEIVHQWGDDIGMTHEMTEEQRTRFARHLKLIPVEGRVSNILSNTPAYLGGYEIQMHKALSNVINSLGHLMTHKDNIIYDILACYRVISLCNPAVTPSTAAGLCVHMTFFTYTHLRMCIEGVNEDISRETADDFFITEEETPSNLRMFPRVHEREDDTGLPGLPALPAEPNPTPPPARTRSRGRPPTVNAGDDGNERPLQRQRLLRDE